MLRIWQSSAENSVTNVINAFVVEQFEKGKTPNFTFYRGTILIKDADEVLELFCNKDILGQDLLESRLIPSSWWQTISISYPRSRNRSGFLEPAHIEAPQIDEPVVVSALEVAKSKNKVTNLAATATTMIKVIIKFMFISKIYNKYGCRDI